MDQRFTFDALVKKGDPYIFEIGEEQLIDKIFYKLCGLDNIGVEFACVVADQLDFSKSSSNNILALGDSGMFLPNKTVGANLYKAYRARMKKIDAMRKVIEVLDIYGLSDIANVKIKKLDEGRLIDVALARAHVRNPLLVVVKRVGGYISCQTEIDFTKFEQSYIIEIR
ncbi:MAG: hypothetical protein FWE45_02450 [Firmicutes bacterium]|nr:hypothetical protein [Bacillota bacterium]